MKQALVVQRLGLRTRNAQTPVRVRPGALVVFDNLVAVWCAHDVAAACCLAMAEVRVRLPLGALVSGRRKVWESACLGRSEIAGSNPAVLTILQIEPFGQNVEGLSLCRD